MISPCQLIIKINTKNEFPVYLFHQVSDLYSLFHDIGRLKRSNRFIHVNLYDKLIHLCADELILCVQCR